jgi:hypothetical protein
MIESQARMATLLDVISKRIGIADPKKDSVTHR